MPPLPRPYPLLLALALLGCGGFDWKNGPSFARDADGDGFLDTKDRCPQHPEDFDSFEDEDGCPDNDNDRDGILDVDDRCPNVPEDIDGDSDADGCPEDPAGDLQGGAFSMP